MISITSITNNYVLQPSLLDKHKNTLEWLSTAVLWKRELAFAQKLLDLYSGKFSCLADKKKIDHFQNLIIYYRYELIDSLISRLRLHEKKLAEILESKNKAKTDYFKEHDTLMNELEGVNTQFAHNKEELFNFIERVV